MSKVYLTRYEEYPIYEPAEGGYYYAGRQVDVYYECDSIQEAKQQLNDLKADLEKNGFDVYEDGACLSSKYIGEGARWYIEENLGEHEKGYHPYC